MTTTTSGFGPRWATPTAVVLLASGLAWCLVVYSGRLQEPPEVAEARDRRPHQCARADCLICECERDWLRRNPDRTSGDLIDSAELGYDLKVRRPETAPAAEGPAGTPSSR